jgi:hypothetical protein
MTVKGVMLSWRHGAHAVFWLIFGNPAGGEALPACHCGGSYGT